MECSVCSAERRGVFSCDGYIAVFSLAARLHLLEHANKIIRVFPSSIFKTTRCLDSRLVCLPWARAELRGRVLTVPAQGVGAREGRVRTVWAQGVGAREGRVRTVWAQGNGWKQVGRRATCGCKGTAGNESGEGWIGISSV